MSILSDLGVALQGAVDFTMGDAVLTAAGGTRTTTAGGAVSFQPSTHPCRAKINVRKSTSPDGGTIFTTEVIILAGSLSGEPKPGNTVTLDGNAYKISDSIRMDGLRSHWVCGVVDG